MSSLNMTSQSDIYDVVVTASPVFECALGIAAYTWPVMVDKLERTPEQWRSIIAAMSAQAQHDVDLAGQVHTWRSLLFLAHRCPDLFNIPLKDQVSHFMGWMAQLGKALPATAAPYLGSRYETLLAACFEGNQQARSELLMDFHTDPLVGPNLQYLLDTDPVDIERHLCGLLIGWYQALSMKEEVLQALERDADDKQSLATSVTPAELVKQATRGSELQPEPMIRRIWLIPQISYRPFTISNRLPETSVLYYPVADEWVPGHKEHQSTLQVANLHKAVGDVHRVRILKLLHHSPRSVTEIGHLLDVSKSTAHHHLTLLRSVGLVQVENGLYALNAQSVRELGPRLSEYVGVGEIPS